MKSLLAIVASLFALSAVAADAPKKDEKAAPAAVKKDEKKDEKKAEKKAEAPKTAEAKKEAKK